MARKNTLFLIIILALFAFAVCALIYPMFDRDEMRLGLDLIGGVHLVYQADFPEDATGEERAAGMERALITIEKRIDKYGVTEPIIQQLGEDRILVQLPGFTDIDAAKSLVEQTGFLEFREVELNEEEQLVYLSDYFQQDELQFINEKETGDRVFVIDVVNAEGEREHETVAFLAKDNDDIMFTDASGNPIDDTALEEYADALSWIIARGDDGTPLTGDLLADAYPSINQSGVAPTPQVSIEWDSEGSVIFDQIAARLYPRPNNENLFDPERALGIFLDNTLLSAPEIAAQKFEGRGVITGNFTTEEVTELANLLKSGSLPMPLKKPPLYEEKVSATLGADFIDMSLKAGIIGIILVMLFMIIYYRLPGVLASLALVFYAALVLAIFKLIPVTLTLAGIGGFVLSIGMAVDANVLIFERMKEEFATGRTLGAAIEAGFNRAWTAIRDSNVTTFIVCGVLYWLGSSIVASAPVMGFAVTLFIGVAVSMFTAIVVTRTLLRLFVGTPLASKIRLFSAHQEMK